MKIPIVKLAFLFNRINIDVKRLTIYSIFLRILVIDFPFPPEPHSSPKH